MKQGRRTGRKTTASAVVRKTIVTIGKLVFAACEIADGKKGTRLVLSPVSPMSKLVGGRIVVA